MEGLELFDAKSGGGGDQIEGVGGLMGGAGAAGGLPSTPAPPPITEEESQMAAETIRLMMDRKTGEALQMIRALSKLRSDDHLVQLNASVIRFEAGEIATIDELDYCLKKVYNQMAHHAASDLDETEHFVLYYNLALVAFLSKNFSMAQKILVKVHLGLTAATSPGPGVTSSDSGGSEEDAGVAFYRQKVAPLLVATCLNLRQPNNALNYLNCAASIQPPQGGKNYATTARGVLDRAMAMVQCKQYKAFKRDIKPNGTMTGDSLTAYEFLRANLEYVKCNHRKATKLLGLGMQNHSQQEGSKEGLPDYTTSMFSNNLGCINIMLNKPNLGIFYLDRAMAQHRQSFQSQPCDSVAGRKTFALRFKHSEMTYNLGLAFLQAKKPREAFQTLAQVVPDFKSNPCLWLHLAECCVALNAEENDVRIAGALYGNSDSTEQVNPVNTVTSVGSNSHRKLILTSHKKHRDLPTVGTKPGLSPTLSFANSCLMNALYLLEGQRVSSDADTVKTPPPPPPTPSSSNNNTNNMQQTSPLKTAANSASAHHSRIQILKANVLLNRSYVCLCLNDPTTALDCAQSLLALSSSPSSPSETGTTPSFSLPSGHRILANIYAADALIQLDQISDAIKHLDPLKSIDVSKTGGQADVSFQEIPPVTPNTTNNNNNSSQGLDDSEAVKASQRRNSAAVSLAKSVFHHNLIVAFVLRGELEKADGLLERLWADHVAIGSTGNGQQVAAIGPHYVLLRAYVALARGDSAKCRDIIKNNCNIVSVARRTQAITSNVSPHLPPPPANPSNLGTGNQAPQQQKRLNPSGKSQANVVPQGGGGKRPGHKK